MQVTGTVKLIGETQTFDSGFTKRQLVVSTDEQYSQDIAMDFVKDKTELLNKFKVGEKVSVSINIRGNEYNGKYYVNLNGWRIEANNDAPGSDMEAQSTVVTPPATDEEDSGLPF